MKPNVTDDLVLNPDFIVEEKLASPEQEDQQINQTERHKWAVQAGPNFR
jgi:hypothetical protein